MRFNFVKLTRMLGESNPFLLRATFMLCCVLRQERACLSYPKPIIVRECPYLPSESSHVFVDEQNSLCVVVNGHSQVLICIHANKILTTF